MKNNQKGFGVVEIILILVILSIIGFTGWRVYEANKEVSQTPVDNSTVQKSQGESKNDVARWERIYSGHKAFSAQMPNGWGEVLRPLSEDLLSIRGQEQPKYEAGKPVVVRDLEGWGTDGPSILTIMIHDNFAEPRGTSVDFKAGDVKGKKYTYVVSQDSERGLGQEDKGDKYYDYRFDLKDGKQLVVWYNVYSKVDAADQVETIDQIVESIKLR